MIHIIAVSYFGSPDLPGYVDSLLAQSHADWRLTIVDNSCDPSERRAIAGLATLDERVHVESPEANLGYLGAARHVTTSVPGHSVDWTVISNTDLTLGGPDALKILAASLDPAVGQVAPSIISGRSGRDQNPYLVEPLTEPQARRRKRALGSPALAQASIIVSDARRRIRPGSESAAPSGTEIYAAHGSFIALSRYYFVNQASLDHPLFLFGEEIFLANELERASLTCVYRPDIVVRHREHGQTKLFRSRQTLRYSVEAARYSHRIASTRTASRGSTSR